MHRYHFKTLNEEESKEQYQVKISHRSEALENFDDNADINTAWGTITESIKVSAKESSDYCEFKQHKP
jgi:hypothetical protein